MLSILSSLSNHVILTVLALQCFLLGTHAYMPLSDEFLRNISSGGPDFEPGNGALLSPILVPRVPGTAGHAAVQQHFVKFFSTQLPKWNLQWYNSTAQSAKGIEVPISNLVFSREPPWTRTGQANWLTLAVHYDSKSMPEGHIGSTSAVPCAILMHVARTIDGFMTQMHDEMNALGEGGTVAMDMGIQLMFLDGTESLDGGEAALYGSRDISNILEKQVNPIGSGYPNSLSQIRIFALLDGLGAVNATVASFCLVTSWVYQRIAVIEGRMWGAGLLETNTSTPFLSQYNASIVEAGMNADYVPFMERGTPYLNLQPSPSARNPNVLDDASNLNLPTVRDWVKIVTVFTMEWLDMMEVWPE